MKRKVFSFVAIDDSNEEREFYYIDNDKMHAEEAYKLAYMYVSFRNTCKDCERIFDAMKKLEYEYEHDEASDLRKYIFDLRERRLRNHTRVDMLCIYSHKYDEMLTLFDDVEDNDVVEALETLEVNNKYRQYVYDAIYDMLFCDISYSSDTHILTITID